MKEGRGVLFDDQRQALRRALAGAAVGVAIHLLLGYLMGSFSLFGPSQFRGFEFPTCGFPYRWETLGAALSFVLFALFGAEVGISTLPFAGHGRALAIRTTLHFLLMEATAGVWVVLNGGLREVPACLVPLTLVYCMIWLVRWIGWYAEVAAIREKLGLSPGPSPLKWKETMPYIPFALGLCLVLPALLWVVDAPDVPVLSGILYPMLLAVGCFFSGVILAKHQGFCLLYPVLCGLFLIPTGLWLYHAILPYAAVALLAALVGEVLGLALKMARERKED